MATVLDKVYCTSCGGRHMLCYPDDDVFYSNRDYEYECPVTRRPTLVPRDEWGQVAPDCPEGVIVIREVKS